MGDVRALDGKPAAFSGTTADGGKIVVIVGGKLRFLSRREWMRLRPWRGPEPYGTSLKKKADRPPI